MKRALALFLLALPLLGCEGAAQKAERRYEMVEKSGDHRAQCLEAGKVADAYLDAGNQEKYDRWKNTRDIDCLRVRLDAAN